MEPLSVALVWNREDQEYVQKYVDYVTEMLSYDIERPFSRTINLPVFYYTNMENNEVPPYIKLNSEKIIVYVFIGINCVASDMWSQYIESLYEIENIKVVPIALDEYAFNISKKVNVYNFIREFEIVEYKEQQLFISMAHEIYRYGFNEKKEIISGDSALKIFLSHAKEGKCGLNLAKQLKHLIDDSPIKRFFDSNDIAPGYRFDEEIINNIKESSVIIINSDVYSSRYWCQREIQVSKEYERPIIEVDLIQKAMDRKFPFAGNVPVVRADIIDGKVETDDLYRILENIMIETIRFNYVDIKLGILTQKMTGNIKRMCRPPEMIDIPKIVKKGKTMEFVYDKIIYPDPPIYSEEIEFFRELGVEVYTPIEYEKGTLIGKKVGISISESSSEDLGEKGQRVNHLSKLSQALSNYILGRGAILVYGGDFRKGGYTEQIIQEAQILRSRLRTQEVKFENFISWPIYLNDTLEVKEWRAKYKELMEIREIPLDTSVSDLVENENTFLPPNSMKNCWIWSKSLSKMRYEMIGECDARICSGGRKTGYKGKMPGVLEEIVIAIEKGCPIYLLGGFGGIVHDICDMIQYGIVPDSLTEEWQIANNEGYSKLLRKYEENKEKVNYISIQEKIKNINLKNGLTKEENEILFNTVYVDEAVQLILKGLQSL